jgi:hypothetical protein
MEGGGDTAAPPPPGALVAGQAEAVGAAAWAGGVTLGGTAPMPPGTGLLTALPHPMRSS